MPKKVSFPPDSSLFTSVDGKIVPPQKATLAIQDWGFRYGWGAFETIRLTEGRPLFLVPHLQRLARTAAALLIDDSDRSDWWRREIVRTASRAGLAEGAINLYWTRGESPRFVGRRIVVVRPQSGRAPRRSRIWVAPWCVEPGSPGVGSKTLCYLPYTFATLAAQMAGFDDAILLNPRGRIADGSAASLFVIENGQLLTPGLSDGALPGITRAIVLECARGLGITTIKRPLSMRRAQNAHGAFLTSSLRGLTVVRSIGNHDLGMTPEARQLIGLLQRAYRRAAKADIAAFKF